jgi:hypothetical protein
MEGDMPEISRFFGIVIRMYFDDHVPPHVHVEYQGQKATFEFDGAVRYGSLGSRTATRLVQDWIKLHVDELQADWELAQNGNELKPIRPLE